MRVVLVDDHETLRTALRRTLELVEGVEVIAEAADGAEALEVVRASRPDVVLMDVRMPRIDGIEATRQIRQALPEVAVVGLSSSFDMGTVADMMAAGAAAFVAKGTRPTELLDAVADAAAGRVRSPSPEQFR